MNRRQKKTLKFLVLLVAALAILLAAVSAVKRHKAQEEEAAAAASSEENTVTDSEAEYSALTYSNSTATLSFALNEEGSWYWVDDPEFPLDETYIIKLVNTITGLQPQQTITGGDALEDYGLDAPAMTITAAPPEGEPLTMYLGNQVSGDSGSYYLYIDGDDTTIYVVEGTLASELSQGIYDMMSLPELPLISEESFDTITVQGAVETVLTAAAEKTAVDSGDGSSSSAGQSEEITVTWHSGSADVTDNDTVRSLVSAIRTLSLERCVDYKPSDAAVSLCGFDEPAATVTALYRDDNGAEQTLTLAVGGTTLEGGSRYVRVNDDTTIYSIAEDKLSAVLTAADSGLTA